MAHQIFREDVLYTKTLSTLSPLPVPKMGNIDIFFTKYISPPSGASLWPMQCLERIYELHNVHALAAHKGSEINIVLQHINVFLTLHTNTLFEYSVLTSKNEVW